MLEISIKPYRLCGKSKNSASYVPERAGDWSFVREKQYSCFLNFHTWVPVVWMAGRKSKRIRSRIPPLDRRFLRRDSPEKCTFVISRMAVNEQNIHPVGMIVFMLIIPVFIAHIAISELGSFNDIGGLSRIFDFLNFEQRNRFAASSVPIAAVDCVTGGQPGKGAARNAQSPVGRTDENRLICLSQITGRTVIRWKTKVFLRKKVGKRVIVLTGRTEIVVIVIAVCGNSSGMDLFQIVDTSDGVGLFSR